MKTPTLFTSMITAIDMAVARALADKWMDRVAGLNALRMCVATVDTNLAGGSPANVDKVYTAMLAVCDEYNVFE